MKVTSAIAPRDRGRVVGYILMGIATSVLTALGIHLFQRLLDDYAAGVRAFGPLAGYGLVLIGGCVLAYLDNLFDTQLLHGLYLNLKLQALEKMQRIAYPAYQNLGVGQLIQRIENGAAAGRDILYKFYFHLARELIPSIALSLLFIGLMDLRILGVLLGGYAVLFLVTRVVLKHLYQIKERILVHEEWLNSHLVRGLTEMLTFRINRYFPAELRQARSSARDITQAKTQMVMIHEFFFAFFYLLVLLMRLGILVYSFLAPQLTVGEIVALCTFLDNAYQPIAVFNVLYVQYKLDQVAFQRYGEILDLPDDPHLQTGEPIKLTGGEVALQRVDFAYAGRGGALFHRLSLTLPSGGFYALVGESGSGKSTLIQLVLGLQRPAGGQVRIDGQDLAAAHLSTYYEQVAYVSQTPPVFEGTLRENLAFSQPVPDAQLIGALRAMRLGEFFDRLPQGLDTPIGERGGLLSGGERQRLALARVCLSPARLIILDEATSALDTLTEAAVMAELAERLAGRTRIVIAHRLSTVRQADRLLVMRDGRLIDQGRYEELLDRCPYFRSLVLGGQP